MQISEIESVTTMAVLASICLLSLLISTPLKRNTISAERNPQGNPPRDDDDDDEIDGDPVQSATAFWAQVCLHHPSVKVNHCIGIGYRYINANYS